MWQVTSKSFRPGRHIWGKDKDNIGMLPWGNQKSAAQKVQTGQFDVIPITKRRTESISASFVRQGAAPRAMAPFAMHASGTFTVEQNAHRSRA